MIIDRTLIQEAKEKLGIQNAFLMADILKLDGFDEKNLKALCKWHDEKHASLIYNPKNYTFHCFSCNRTVDILNCIELAENKTFIEAVRKLFELAEIPYSFGEHKVKTKTQYRYPTLIENENKEKVYSYLEKRKISKDTIDYLDIRQDNQGNIVFNYYDTQDVLTMVKYRPSRKVEKGENKNWCQPNSDTTPLLYNMNRINPTQPLIITTGELDCASVIESGYTNCVSVPLGDGNTQWISECWDFLEQFSEIIVFHDNDPSGEKFIKDIVPRLGSWRCKIATCPQYTVDKKYKIKDVNEVLFWEGKPAVARLISEAKDTSIDSVTDFSDITDIDLDSMDGINTGFSDLDKDLTRLFYGTLTIVTGSPGSGKTSILYQVICQALEQGKHCWLYSKEMSEAMSKNWFNYILAGRRNIEEAESRDGSKFFRVNKSAKTAINEHYKGQCFFYRNDRSNKLEDLILSMTETVRKYGVKLLIVDNLMTIDMDASADNELLKQTDVINQLIRFAIKFQVAVILVAHPRKLQMGESIGLYSVSGSSNIINLSHRAISLKRVTKKEKEEGCLFDVKVGVLKDRIAGRITNEIGLYYDATTRRFFSNRKEFGYQYSWDTKEYKDELPYPIDENDAIKEVFGI